ncbi:hypothetical protein F7734_47850 [Scytonema sp. UIC 10036]|uniref:hypothetical protein n=1 Tax=Scytonema sp. UIC 10036 TaxID=2304196 RepID=UPI0012DA4902|nr:hypothetical protein [Scytonema sp. UIC 10036]MUG99591.1 hypothetical protein [Scytonema sp. UIC 10036]
MTMIEPHEKRKNLELAKDSIDKKIEYINVKMWNIFSWSSSLLIGSIAGAVVLKRENLGVLNRILLCIAVIALAANAFAWLKSTYHILNAARKLLQAVDDELGIYKQIQIIKDDKPLKTFVLYELGAFTSYHLTLVLLAFVSILMILLPII